MAAGVLFYAVHEHAVHFLIGKEQYHPHWPDSEKWADCGGGVDAKDVDVYETAAREAWEETMGCVHTYETLLSRLRNDEAQCVFDVQVVNGVGGYRIYLLHVPYADYNTMLVRFRSFLRRHKVQIMNAEKSRLCWICSQQLIDIARECDAGRNTLLRPNFAKSVVAINELVDLDRLS